MRAKTGAAVPRRARSLRPNRNRRTEHQSTPTPAADEAPEPQILPLLATDGPADVTTAGLLAGRATLEQRSDAKHPSMWPMVKIS
jgi:hypothetical protein